MIKPPFDKPKPGPGPAAAKEAIDIERLSLIYHSLDAVHSLLYSSGLDADAEAADAFRPALEEFKRLLDKYKEGGAEN